MAAAAGAATCTTIPGPESPRIHVGRQQLLCCETEGMSCGGVQQLLVCLGARLATSALSGSVAGLVYGLFATAEVFTRTYGALHWQCGPYGKRSVCVCHGTSVGCCQTAMRVTAVCLCFLHSGIQHHCGHKLSSRKGAVLLCLAGILNMD